MPKPNKLKLNSRLLRIFITMDQLAKRLKACRSSIDAAVERYKKENPTIAFDEKLIRTGKRGPMTRAIRIAR